jgi:protein phosphatase 1 regulatory subunit 7
MLAKYHDVSVLDLSFNLIKVIPESLSSLTSLKTVYFVQNRITKISGLSGVGATLRSLELGGNKIRVRSEFDHAQKLLMLSFR